jgi:hypothetical protein
VAVTALVVLESGAMITAPDRRTRLHLRFGLRALRLLRDRPQFPTILRRQRDDAVDHSQNDRGQLLECFIDDIDAGA